MKRTITITEDDFINAISKVTMNSFKDPNFEDKPEASMMFCLGGAVFARQVMTVLFDEEESEETAKVHFKEEFCCE